MLLVGGSTYIPAVWELAADATGLDPRQEVHPEGDRVSFLGLCEPEIR